MMNEEKLNIIVIEDSERQAQKIVESYEEAIKIFKEKRMLKEKLGMDEVTVEWMKGGKAETMRNQESFRFYTDDVYEQIEKKIDQNQTAGIKTGILLDVSLSREEYDKASVNEYYGFKMAKTIYERFEQKATVYIITSIREFSSQVLSLMGTKDLIERYISKDLVVEYPSYGVIARTIRYMYDRKELDEKEEDILDQLA